MTAPSDALFDGNPTDVAAIAAALLEARERTLELADAFHAADLLRPVAEYLSPPVWDLGHIAQFAEMWLIERLHGRPPTDPQARDTYDAVLHPRPERPSLPLLSPDGALAYLDAQLNEVLRDLESGLPEHPLARDGFLHWLLVLHEHQHQETLIQSLQMQGAGRAAPRRRRTLPRARPERSGSGLEFVSVPGGEAVIGRAQQAGVYDNEAPENRREMASFELGRTPVTNEAYLRFVEEGGYEDDSFWSAAGVAWRTETRAEAPLYWQRMDGAWHRTGFDGLVEVARRGAEITSHVSFFEAEAFAKWAGARLPTEAEWEYACRGPEGNLLPWGARPSAGVANLDHLGWGPSEAGAYPGGASWCGAEQLVGDVWEWCSDGFHPYPGFKAHPYREYSEIFFGDDYRMLRGGSWATRPTIGTGTFRNWDLPRRRQIISGIRLAR